MAEDKAKGQKKSVFQTARSEFKKIVWLDRPTWFRQIVVVIVMAVIIALVIALIDFVVKYGVDLLLSL